MSKRRIEDEAAYILHSYDWSESSLILEAFTRSCGRRAIVAKGVKRPLSGFRSTLLPLQRVRLAFSLPLGHDAQVATLKAAQWGGGATMPEGENLLAGVYMNELLLRFVAREDPHPHLFDVYDQLVQYLAPPWQDVAVRYTSAVVLRAFELVLLKEVGYLPALDAELSHGAPVNAGVCYVLEPSLGLRQEAAEASSTAQDAPVLGISGQQWLELDRVLAKLSPDRPLELPLQFLLDQIGRMPAYSLRIQLRKNLATHSGERPFKTSQFFLQTQAI